ncbi:LytR/AlgR family response regulator transcription factor [Maribacter sp. 4G9]|uniref:LytR/AlgR family response regulator transcription factor n=1 Tax=Maribacter sp. 4G9 TaxID=1889777 RepID=UPI000C146FEC|nr:LytTR family DNA-binding domain-containing protein [Maribacter sp. 4G9]
MLNTLKYRSFDIIITTAYDNYAIKAFRQHAIDYLLKPIDSDDLKEAVNRIRENKGQNLLGAELKSVFSEWAHQKSKKLALPMAGKTLYVDPSEIIYCKADGNYTEVFFGNGKKEVLSKRIKDFEKMLGSTFFRVHNSYLTKLSSIKEFVNQDGQYLILEDGTNVPVSRAKKSELLKILNG